MAVIYALTDPRLAGLDAVRYIGVTTQSLKKRLSVHLSTAKKCADYRGNWITSLRRDGVMPSIEVIEHVDGDDNAAYAREVEVIALFRASGARLTNTTEGGEGALGRRHTEAVKAKIAASKKGVTLSPEHRVKLSHAMRGRPLPAHVVEQSVTRFRSAEHKQKVAAAMRRPEERAKRSATQTGVKKPESHGPAVSAALAGRKLPPHQRDAMVAHHRAPEYRAAMAEVKRKWWADKKARQVGMVA